MTAVQISGLRPGLTLDVQGTAEVWQDDRTGLRVFGESDPAKNPGRGWAVTAGFPKAIRPELTMLGTVESRYLPKTLPPRSLGTPGTWNRDGKPDTRQTGPARRHYVSPCLAAYLLTQDTRWKNAEVNWNLEQGNRPLSHVPFVVSGDRYSKPWVNQGDPALAYNHNTPNLGGWTAFDYAHADSARILGLAALGHPLGIINAAMVWRWLVQSAEPGVCTNWMTQDRSIGWVLNWGILAALLDLGETDKAAAFRDGWCGGWRPRAALKAWVEQLLGLNPDPSRNYAANGRAAQRPNGQGMPVILGGADWLDTGPQLLCQQTFHVALLAWGVGRLIDLNLVPAHTTALRAWAQSYAENIFAKAFDPARGWAWAVGLTDFASRPEAQELLDAAAAEGVGGLEVANHPSSVVRWFVRTIPVWGAELPNMVAPGAALLWGPDDEYVTSLLASPDWSRAPQFDLATLALVGG